MKKALVLALVVGLIAIMAPDACAQQGRRISVEPRVSYWFPNDADKVFGFGVAGEVMFSEWFGLTAAIDFWNFEGDTFSETISAFPDFNVRDLSVGAVFYFMYEGTINPYITFGLDYFLIDDDFGGADAGAFATAGVDDSLGWHAGVGVDIALSGNFSVVVEVRYFDVSFGVDLTEIEIGDVDVNGFAVLAGIEIGF